METVSFKHSMNLVEEDRWLLGVMTFEATNSVFNITDEKSTISTSTPGQWVLEVSEKIVAMLYKLMKLRSENDFELHIEEVGKRGRVLQMLGPDPNNP